tara:strand:- start:4122 stop:4304 length:183 start_codon:yes stop_codon:yes gene_type:complete
MTQLKIKGPIGIDFFLKYLNIPMLFQQPFSLVMPNLFRHPLKREILKQVRDEDEKALTHL